MDLLLFHCRLYPLAVFWAARWRRPRTVSTLRSRTRWCDGWIFRWSEPQSWHHCCLVETQLLWYVDKEWMRIGHKHLSSQWTVVDTYRTCECKTEKIGLCGLDSGCFFFVFAVGIAFLRGFQVSLQALGGASVGCQLFLFHRNVSLSVSHAQTVRGICFFVSGSVCRAPFWHDRF